ncbi:MAG: hydroxyacid dehydrogenase [Opitutales bacterium]
MNKSIATESVSTGSSKKSSASSESGANGGAAQLRKAAYVLNAESFELIYPPEIRRQLEGLADFIPEPVFTQHLEERMPDLAEVEVIFSGWGAPRMDQAFLDALPKLKAVFYGAGSIRGFVTPEFWDRGIRVTSAYAANAIPVSEYTLATILLSLKSFWHYSRLAKEGKGRGNPARSAYGAYRARVGLVSCGMIARKVIERLLTFDLNVRVADPFLTDEEATRLGVERVPLDELFSECEVVSLHAPNLPETRRMIQGSHFKRMKKDATFINTARGAIVAEDELIEAAEQRPDLSFVLDVTAPEPPVPDSKFYSLANIVLTPHIAGSIGNEVERLGDYMLAEFRLYLEGCPLRWEITRETAEKMA